MSRYLALDWDQQLLHVVSGTIAGRNCTIQKAAVWQENKSPNPAEAEELGALLKARLKEAGIAPAPVLVCVPRDCVILKDLRIPAVPAHEEPAIVRFQTVKELTHREEDIVLDFTVVHGSATASLGSDRRVLAVVLRRELFETYQRLCAAAGLKLAGITPRPFGLSCALQRVAGSTPQTPALPGPDSAVAMVLITGRWGEFSVFRGDIPVLTRTINVGGNLASELRRNLAVYAGQSPQHPVQAIYVGGDISEEARDALAGALPDLPLHLFDPFALAGRSVELPEANRDRAGFTAAVGLLYARARKAGLPINFLEPRQPKPPTNPYTALLYAGVAGLALFLGAGGLFAYTRIQAASNELQILKTERDGVDAKLAVEMARGKKVQALADWDTPTWLDEIRDLSYRILHVGDYDHENQLLVTKFETEPLNRSPLETASAKITITGTMKDDAKGRVALKKFSDGLRALKVYSPLAPTITGNMFVLVVKVEKRGPQHYDDAQSDPKKKS